MVIQRVKHKNLKMDDVLLREWSVVDQILEVPALEIKLLDCLHKKHKKQMALSKSRTCLCIIPKVIDRYSEILIDVKTECNTNAAIM